MSIRAIGVAVAVVFAMACRTSGSHTEASGTAQAPSAETHGTSGTAQAPSTGQDPLVVPGPEIKGHASDQVVSGEIGSVSQSSLTISSAGHSKTLEIAPETSIKVEGRDASVAELQEGQQVRASFNQEEGRDVAVEIQVVGEQSSSASTAPSDVSGSTASGGASGSAQMPHDVHHGQGSSASSAQGTGAGQEPLLQPGPAIKGHASDQVVSGKIEDVSASSLTISSEVGDRKVLEIAPETSIVIDGMEGSALDLEEGQEVRASFNQAEGQDVAVEIAVGKESSSAEPKELGPTPGSSDAGSSGAGSSGTSSEPAAPTGGADR